MKKYEYKYKKYSAKINNFYTKRQKGGGRFFKLHDIHNAQNDSVNRIIHEAYRVLQQVQSVGASEMLYYATNVLQYDDTAKINLDAFVPNDVLDEALELLLPTKSSYYLKLSDICNSKK